MDTESTTRIWPRPVCLRTDKERDTRRYTAMVLDGYSPSHAYAMIMDERAEKRREVERRTRGIGEGRAKARRRMERFLAWLQAEDCCDPGLLFCAGHMSPESSILASIWQPRGMVRTGRFFIANRLGNGWWYRLRDSTTTLIDTKAMLASTEWHSLPWQRDPEVTGG